MNIQELIDYGIAELKKQNKEKLADYYHLLNNWHYPFREHIDYWEMIKFNNGWGRGVALKFIEPIMNYIKITITESDLKKSQFANSIDKDDKGNYINLGAYGSLNDESINKWIKENY